MPRCETLNCKNETTFHMSNRCKHCGAFYCDDCMEDGNPCGCREEAGLGPTAAEEDQMDIERDLQ